MNLRLQALAALITVLPVLAHTDPLEEQVFAPAGAARAAAEAAEAALLAPGSYGQGVADHDRARRDYQQGENLQKVQERLGAAEVSFRQAAKNAAAARLTLTTPLASRESARKAEAFRLAGGRWLRAEEQFRQAALRLEKGDVKGAREAGDQAAASYGEAELEAIKAAVLTEARGLVVTMDQAGTERLAPKTTARARSLLQQAEAALTQDRYKTDEPMRLAAEAGREARHAVALAAMLRRSRERDATPEDLALQWEESVARAAAAAGLSADFSDGPQEAGAAVARSVEALRQKSEQQARDLAERERQVANLEEEIRELDVRLAGASTEARTLTMRLEARERQRQQFQQLEKLFTPGEAEVLRDSGRIIVRLKGLNFGSGSAQLTPAATGLMEKVRQAVGIFPRGEIVAEGHTDSVGDNAANQRLSQSRAEAVRTYMVEKLHVQPGRVRAIGYGDTRPIASNETSEGRRQNRRIDLVIAARLDDGP